MSECPDNAQPRQGRSRPLAGRLSGWGISAMVHLAAVLILWVVVIATPTIIVEPPPTKYNLVPASPPEAIQRVTVDQVVLPTIEIASVPDTESPIQATVQAEIPKELPEPATETVATSDGRIGGEASLDAGASAMTSPIGSGPSQSASILSLRNPSSRKQAVLRYCRNRDSETAVEASLRWFVRHQGADGSWDPVKYAGNCSEGAKCEPGRYNDASGPGGSTVAVTAYALMCFLGAGHDHQTANKYRSQVKAGIDFLLRQQEPNGSWGRNYEHPIALMAIAEAYAMTQDAALQQPCRKALAVLLARQNQDVSGGKGLGWDYVGPNRRNDASTTGWNVMALKSCLAAGLPVGAGMEGARNWLDKAWRASNTASLVKAGLAFQEAAAMTVRDKSRFAYVWMTGDAQVAATGPVPGGRLDLAAKPSEGDHSLESVGLVCGIFLGRSPGDPLIESLANTVMEHQMPGSGAPKVYYTYYNTLSLFQLGGERWKVWNGKVRDVLVDSQERTVGCKEGSWDPARSGTVGGIGRTLTTAYNTLSLEVYYRYKQLQAH